jgi:hypothetical protein
MAMPLMGTVHMPWLAIGAPDVENCLMRVETDASLIDGWRRICIYIRFEENSE